MNPILQAEALRAAEAAARRLGESDEATCHGMMILAAMTVRFLGKPAVRSILNAYTLPKVEAAIAFLDATEDDLRRLKDSAERN